MKKAFIKMNEGKDYLSLGNLFNSIKKTPQTNWQAFKPKYFVHFLI